MIRSLIYDYSSYKNSEKPYAREPVIALMPNGTLVCALVTGGPTEPHNDNFVTYHKSYDGGKTWTEPQILFSHAERGVWATEIYMGYEYPMMVVSTYNGDCPYKELQTFVSYTYDNGESWTKPQSVAPYANGVSMRKGIKMSNGETLFPIYFTSVIDGFGEKYKKMGDSDFWKGTRHSSGVVISSDGGKSYTPYGNFIGKKHLWEPNCVEIENGHIIMFMRDSFSPYVNKAESFDYGKTWKHSGVTEIPNADTKLTLFKIKNTLFLVINANPSLEYSGRTDLQIMRSNDGIAWEFVTYVDEKCGHYFYPHVAVDEKNEKVYLAYENGCKQLINCYDFCELL